MSVKLVQDADLDHYSLMWDKEKVGGVCLRPIRDNMLYVGEFNINEKFQGCGFGKQMMAQAVRIGENGGYAVMQLVVRQTNDCALHIYKSFGFKMVDSTLSLLVMERKLFPNRYQDENHSCKLQN